MTLARSIVQKSCRVNRRVRRNKKGRRTSEPKQNRSATFVDTLISRKAILPHKNAVPHNDPANARAMVAVIREVLDRDLELSPFQLQALPLENTPECYWFITSSG
jgi:hypothetical protein